MMRTEASSKGLPGAVAVACIMLALVGTVGPASARQYGAGDIGYLVNLWDTNRTGFKGTVQSIDTFSALGTVDTIGKAGDGSAAGVVIVVGLSAQVSCPSGGADLTEGDSVAVSGRIVSAATAVSQAKTGEIGGPKAENRVRDSLVLQACTVQKVGGPAK